MTIDCDFCGERALYHGSVTGAGPRRFFCRGCRGVARSFTEQVLIVDAERLRLRWRLLCVLRRIMRRIASVDEDWQRILLRG